MPAAEKRQTKTYGGPVSALTNNAGASVYVAPGLPNRTLLLIQNSGAGDLLLRFGQPVQGDGSDLTFAAGAGLLFDRAETCPEAPIYIGSLAGTTFCIVEQVVPS